MDKSSLPKFEFPGTFYSNNIINPLEAKLITMPDNSFGFTMDISEKGLDAYNNKITLYNSLLDSTDYMLREISNTTLLYFLRKLDFS